jgi:transcriptional regulator with XRE-family HTH domain
MDKVSIGSNILRLRKEKGMTQEELGVMIGVSGGAVSKWETENSKPDIELLAPLARALNTSLNELLSFKEELSETEVAKIKKELTNIFLHNGFFDGEIKCKEYLNKYPNSSGLKLTVASLIQMYTFLLGNDFNKLVKSKKQYALSLLYKVVETKESNYLQTALFIIASIQMELENYNESEKCIKKLLDSFVDPMILNISLLQKQNKYKDAEILCKKMLLFYLNQSISMLSILSNIAKLNHNFDKSVFYLNAVIQIEHSFNIGLYSGSYNLCKLHLEEGDKYLAAKYFKSYVEGLLSTEYDYFNNPYFDNIQLQINPEGQKIIRQKLYQTLIDDNDLRKLDGISEYGYAIKKLKATLSVV